MIQRCFLPVGQGAFYSERHMFHNININIVYDCGTEYKNRNNTDIKNVVRQSFSEDDVIDILFISHFDFDHISLIDTLRKTVKRIKRVVIPLLQEEEKVFLYNVYKALGEDDLAQLVNKPNEFFGEGTHIITIDPSSGEENRGGDPIVLSDEARGSQSVRSGTPLTLPDIDSYWVFVPYNHEYQSRRREFCKKLTEEGIDIDKLRHDSQYTLCPAIKKTIKDIYKGLSGGINENSMFLYSGPLYKKDLDIHFWRRRYWLKCLYWEHPYYCTDHYNTYRVACLYTGDGDLNKVDVRSVYKQYWDLIGTIQIPHHGSLPSFNEKVLDGRRFICPISVGKNNSYGHPSQKVISEILLHESYPILVTEDIDSALVEVIKCRC